MSKRIYGMSNVVRRKYGKLAQWTQFSRVAATVGHFRYMFCGFDLNVICNNAVFCRVHASSDLVRNSTASNSSGSDGSQQHEMICLWFLLLITEFLLTALFLVLSFTPTSDNMHYLSCIFLSFSFYVYRLTDTVHNEHNAFDPMYLTRNTTIVRLTHSMHLMLVRSHRYTQYIP